MSVSEERGDGGGGGGGRTADRAADDVVAVNVDVAVDCVVCWQLAVYLRHTPTQTVARAAILRQKPQIKLATLPSHRTRTSGRPVLVFAL